LLNKDIILVNNVLIFEKMETTKIKKNNGYEEDRGKTHRSMSVGFCQYIEGCICKFCRKLSPLNKIVGTFNTLLPQLISGKLSVAELAINFD